MKHTPLFALTALALAPAVHAQTLMLHDGDIVTVSGAGTVGTISGVPIANTTTSYGSSSNVNGYAVTTQGTTTFTLGSGSSLTATGTSGRGLNAAGSGPVTITGGTLTGMGNIGYALLAAGSSPISITGGSFTATGAGGFALRVALNSAIDLYGMFDGLTLGQTQTLPSSATGTFTGTLENNTIPQTFTYDNNGTIRLHDVGLASAPEPSPFAAFGVGLLCLGALAVKAKRRTA